MKKEEPAKLLYIELKKDIQQILKDYCKASGIQKEDLGFAMGFMTAIGQGAKEPMEQIMFLTQLYFFAGVYYAKTTKGFGFEYLNQQDRGKKRKEVEDRLKDLMKPPQMERPTYMG